MNDPTYSFKVEDRVVYTGLTQREVEALVQTIRRFRNERGVGYRFDVLRERG